MQIISQQGDPTLAEVFVARFRDNDRFLAEFVDARDPDLPADAKWVVIISSQFGCPVACPMCDAGGDYRGDLTRDEMLAQVDHVVTRHGAERLSRVEKFKVQFARMGEPALNPAVLDALRELPIRYDAPGLIPCIATTAPTASRTWLDALCDIRHTIYGDRLFQLQLSVNSTDETARNRLMPVAKLSLPELAMYARRFSAGGPRKASLNFVMTDEVPIDPDVIARHFDPESTCVKITPLNPTNRSVEQHLSTALPPHAPEAADALCDALARHGFDIILSIGDVRENEIGSNCGMAVRRYQSESG